LYRGIFASETEVEYFLQNICTHEWNLQQDGGRSFAEAVAGLQSRFPAFASEIAAYDQRWEEMLGSADDETVAILSEVCATRLPVYALTNWSREKFPIARQRYAFLGWFDDILVSGEIGMKKPDIEIFRFFLEKYNLEAQTIFYVDDDERNVATARKVGMQAVKFCNAVALRNMLTDLGVLTEDA
jgi:2-haloacid dehalogenase